MMSALGALWTRSFLMNGSLIVAFVIAVFAMLFNPSNNLMFGVALLAGAMLGNSIRQMTLHTTAPLIPGMAMRSFNAAALTLISVLTLLTLAALPLGVGVPAVGSATLIGVVIITITVALAHGSKIGFLAAIALYFAEGLLPDKFLYSINTIAGQSTLLAIALALLALVRHRLTRRSPAVTLSASPFAASFAARAREGKRTNKTRRALFPESRDALGPTFVGSLGLPLVILMMLSGSVLLNIDSSAMWAYSAIYSAAWPTLQLREAESGMGNLWLYGLPPNRIQMARAVLARAFLRSLPLPVIVLVWGFTAEQANVENLDLISPIFDLRFGLVSVVTGYLVMLVWCLRHDTIRDTSLLHFIGVVMYLFLIVLGYCLGEAGTAVFGVLLISCLIALWRWGHLGLAKADLSLYKKTPLLSF